MVASVTPGRGRGPLLWEGSRLLILDNVASNPGTGACHDTSKELGVVVRNRRLDGASMAVEASMTTGELRAFVVERVQVDLVVSAWL